MEVAAHLSTTGHHGVNVDDKLGTAVETDRYEMGDNLPNVAEIELEMDFSTGRLLASVQNGDGGEPGEHLGRQRAEVL